MNDHQAVRSFLTAASLSQYSVNAAFGSCVRERPTMASGRRHVYSTSPNFAPYHLNHFNTRSLISSFVSEVHKIRGAGINSQTPFDLAKATDVHGLLETILRAHPNSCALPKPCKSNYPDREDLLPSLILLFSHSWSSVMTLFCTAR